MGTFNRKSFSKPMAIAFIALAALLVGCGASEGGRVASGAAKSAPTSADASAAPAAESDQKGAVTEAALKTPVPRVIIYKGQVSLVCENLDKAADQLEAKIREFGAYVGDANRSGNKGRTREATWTIRIPASRFPAFVKSLPSLGELQSSSQEAQDVSEEYYDSESRVKNKRIEEARLIDLLKRGGKLNDVLTVEHELTRVREEIEVIEGRLRFLSNQSELSTVTVTLREVKDFVPAGPPTLATLVARSFGGSVDVMKDLAVGILLLVVALVPWMVPMTLIVWLIARAAMRKRAQSSPPVIQ